MGTLEFCPFSASDATRPAAGFPLLEGRRVPEAPILELGKQRAWGSTDSWLSEEGLRLLSIRAELAGALHHSFSLLGRSHGSLEKVKSVSQPAAGPLLLRDLLVKKVGGPSPRLGLALGLQVLGSDPKQAKC